MNIKISTTIKYNKKYKHLYPVTNKQIDIISPHLDTISSILELPDRLTLLFRPIYRDHFFGSYDNDTETVSIDPRQNTKKRVLLGTLLHELAHANQYMTGMIRDNTDGSVVWNGELYSDCCYTKYDKYVESPWEKDAELIANNILKIIT